jgi:hypothetical protein
MKKEKEKVKEKIDAIIRKNSIETPKQLENAYIAQVIKKLPYTTPSLQTTTRDEVFSGVLLKGIENLFMERGKAIPYNLLDGFKNYFKNKSSEKLKKYFHRLSLETQKTLRENYEAATIELIIRAIIDFEIPVVSAAPAKKLFNGVIEAMKEANRERKEIIKACKCLLAKVFLTQAETEVLGGLRNRFETPNEQVYLDPIKEVELANINFDNLIKTNPATSPLFQQKWFLDWLSEMLKFEFKRPRGASKNIYFKALQVVIYKLLTIEPPKKIKRYLRWAETLTANIINECYKGKGLSKLTAKDINNALHSS